MSKTHPPCAPEYRRQTVELVHAGRAPGELALEYECSVQAIRNWVRQAGRYARTAWKTARLRVSRLNSTATRWMGQPRCRNLSA